jgi:NTP pyrophosphatase (non-canonical NTP hydrolase)
MDFQFIIDRGLEIRKLYEEKEKQLYGSPWTSEEIMLGFVGDVGDLAKLVIAENGKRNIENSKQKLEHELADCLWSLIVLAHVHDVDLESSFMNTMNELQKYLLDERNAELNSTQNNGTNYDS